MSEFPDPDFTALRNAQRVRQFGSRLESVEGGVRSGVRGLAGEGKGEGLTRGVDLLHQGADEARRAGAQTYASAAAADEAVALADHWSAVAPKDADIDAADVQVQQASTTLREVSRGKNYAAEMAAAAALKAAQQNAAVLRQQRIQADESYSTGMTALAAKVEQQTAAAASRTFVTDYTPNTKAFAGLKPPARTTPGTPAAPRTPAGAAPSPFAPRTPAADDAVAKLMAAQQAGQGQPVTLPGQQQQQAPQGQQQPHPQAVAGGAPTGIPTAKPADRKRDSDSAPTGLAAAVGATGAGASPLHPTAAAARPAGTGFSRDGMVTATNVSGRPVPGVSLSGGMPATAPAQAAGTSAAPGTGGMPMAPGMGGVGNGKTSAARPAPRIVKAEPLEDGVVPGGTILRGDEPPEQRAS